jgi:hypothetical protein
MLLLTACSSDSADDTQQEEWEDIRLELRGVTRVGESSGNMGDIRVFLYSATDGTTEGLFKYRNETGTHYWTAQNLKVKPGTRTFWLYGYMPAVEGITGEILDERQLKLSGIQPISLEDICIVTGVKVYGSSVLPLRGTFEFEYKNSDYNDVTVLNLLLEHMLGHVDFKFKIGSRYSQLRKIKVKSLTIKTTSKSSISATINLPTNTEDVVTITYSATGADRNYETTLLANTADPIELTTSGVSVGSGINVAVGTGLSENFVLESEYEVYDLKGNLLSTRTASNNLSGVLPVMGQKKEVVLTVEPTYLYQLSDDDLNNPVVTIE